MGARRLETLLALVLTVLPVTGFQLLPGLGRPSFGLSRCGHLHNAAVARGLQRGGGPVLAQGVRERDRTPGQLGLALMEPPSARDDAAKREFELNRGLAVDTLLADYPAIFSHACDLSIFHESILLRDSQGFSLEGIRSYKAFFSVVPTLVNVAFSRAEVSALLMDKYGIDKGRIKIRWRLDLYPRSVGASLRDIFGWCDTLPPSCCAPPACACASAPTQPPTHPPTPLIHAHAAPLTMSLARTAPIIHHTPTCTSPPLPNSLI